MKNNLAENIKKVLVQMAIDCTLPMDMNELDMDTVLEKAGHTPVSEKKTFVVLFDLDEIDDSRTKAENIENRHFLIKNTGEKDDIVTAHKVAKAIIEELEIPLTQLKYVSVFPITDFMDLYNNEECNEVGTFLSYVTAEMVD